ncbi:MAG: hypothetical protein RL398_646 [Planctomycetota bacterium]
MIPMALLRHAFCGALAFLVAAPLAAQTSDFEHARSNVFGQMPWRELGPVLTGGRIVDIAVHPTQRSTFWVAAASGGLWRTDNAGMSFVPQFQDAESISIGDLAVAPSNGDVLYVGTGEANNQRSSYWGNGVHKSTDGGKTWRHVGLAGTEHIGRVIVHPTNPDIVYVAALGALYTPNEERGLYRTKDGGASWQRIHHLGPDVGFVDIAMDPQHPDTLIASSYERRRRAWNFQEGGPGSRLWRSVDGGDKWQALTQGLPAGDLGRIGVEFFAGDGNVVYATIENLNPAAPTTAPSAETAPNEGGRDGDAAADTAVDVPAELLADPVAYADFERKVTQAQDPQRQPRKRLVGGEVYRSDDGGTTWSKTHAEGEVGGSPGYYYGQIRVDPSDPDKVYVLGTRLWRSSDGGETFAADGHGGEVHVDHHALWIDPRDGMHCLLGNDGGLAETWDGGKTWRHCARLPILQFYTVSADLAVPYRVYGGLQDNGSVGFPVHGPTSDGISSDHAYRVGGGDGFYVCIDPTDPDVVYSESQFGGMGRLNLRTGERKSIQPRAQRGEPALRFNWNTPIVLSPHAPHTVYTGSQFLHRSRDRGDSWTVVSPDLTTNDADKKQGDVPHCTITTIAESPKQEGRLWIGTDDGRVWTTRDGGGRWMEVTDRFPEAVRGLWVSRVEASAHAADTAFVSFTGYREDHRAPYVFRTDDGGETFKSIAVGLPNEPVNVVRQHPRNEACVLVGTENGIYVSVDHGATWFPLGKGLPRVAVHDLIVHGRESHVLIGTHGRGIWALDAAALETLDAGKLSEAFVALPPSDGVQLRRAPSGGYQGVESWRAANPFVEPTFRYLLAMDSEEVVKIEVRDATGSVLWTSEGPKVAGYHEVVWQARGGGRGGFPGAGGRGRPTGPRPGTFAVVIQKGGQSATQTFTVHDRRPAGSALGGAPGTEEHDDRRDEEAEENAEAEARSVGHER